MKIKRFILGFVLCLCSLFSVFGLTGCGDVSIAEIKTNFETLVDTYAKYNNVFTVGTYQGLSTKYLLNYGTVVDNYVSQNKEGYVELLDIYNATLIVSSDYIDKNKDYISSLKDENVSKSAKASFNQLNKSIKVYTNSIETFVRERNTFMEYFATFKGQVDADNAYLRKFKRAYGDLVAKNVDISTNLAKAVETTEIFELLKKTQPTANDTIIVKEYIRAKLLPIFSKFTIEEVENNLNWSAYPNTTAKNRINNLLSDLNTSFDNYITTFVAGTNAVQTLTEDEMNDLFDLVEVFLEESESYMQALEQLNISKFAIDYDLNLENYKKKNALAETYLEKLEQFIGSTLGNFVDEVLDVIY